MTGIVVSAATITKSVSSFTFIRTSSYGTSKIVNSSGSARYMQVAVEVYTSGGTYVTTGGNEGLTANYGNRTVQMEADIGYTFHHRGGIYYGTAPIGAYQNSYSGYYS